MKWAIAALLAIATVAAASADFKVVNKMPVPRFTVVNRTPKPLPCGKPECTCGCILTGVCNCAQQQPKAEQRIVKTIQTTHRAPVGHTHTCAAGHTWDHQSNPGHTCNALVVRNGHIQTCGLSQYVQDRGGRMVTITKVVDTVQSVPAQAQAVQRPSIATPATAAGSVSYTNVAFPSALFGGGCPNGNCANLRR